MKNTLFCGLIAAALAGCSQPQVAATLARPVPVAATTDVQIALDTYQAALGTAQVALRSNPALLAKVNALRDKAAPYVAAVQAGTADAQAAPSLGALAAEMLITAAPYFKAVPTKA